MVLASTLGFLLVGTAVLVHLHRAPLRGRRQLIVALCLFGMAWALGELITFGLFASGFTASCQGFAPAAWLIRLFWDSEMAPLTACSWLVVATTLFLLATRPGRRRREVAAGCAAAVIAVNVVLLYGFVTTGQLFRHYLGIAVAFPAALGFVFLGMALLAAAGPRTFLLRHLVGPTTLARVLRSFLAVAVGAILLSELIRSHLNSITDQDLRVILVGLWVYVVVVLVGIVVYWVARRVSTALDAMRAELAASMARDMFLAQVSHAAHPPEPHPRLLSVTGIHSAG